MSPITATTIFIKIIDRKNVDMQNITDSMVCCPLEKELVSKLPMSIPNV
jgi:hypothetical protein